jgi:cytochrome P450
MCISGKTNVVIPVGQIQRGERYWQEPEEFDPERFGERREEVETEKAPYLPLSLGTTYLLPCLDK